jgi:NADPH:quinone reductase-like Zn-dependent oxidoreductase
MKAFIVPKYKAALRLAEKPEPKVGPNDVLVRIKAAAVNLLDARIRDGAFKLFRP